MLNQVHALFALSRIIAQQELKHRLRALQACIVPKGQLCALYALLVTTVLLMRQLLRYVPLEPTLLRKLVFVWRVPRDTFVLKGRECLLVVLLEVIA